MIRTLQMLAFGAVLCIVIPDSDAEIEYEVDDYGDVIQTWTPSEDGDGYQGMDDSSGYMIDYGDTVFIRPKHAPGQARVCRYSEVFGVVCNN